MSKGMVLKEHVKELEPLKVGDVVSIQNQTGNHARKWDKSSEILEVLPHNQYRVKIDGSCRISLRNRQFLRKITLFVTNQTGLVRDIRVGRELACDPRNPQGAPVITV